MRGGNWSRGGRRLPQELVVRARLMSGGGGVWEGCGGGNNLQRRGPGAELGGGKGLQMMSGQTGRVREQGQATGGASLVAALRDRLWGWGARRKGLATVW